jgi:hypothetical protein
VQTPTTKCNKTRGIRPFALLRFVPVCVWPSRTELGRLNPVGCRDMQNSRPVKLPCSSPIRCARREKDFFLLSASSSVWDCRLIRRPANDARRKREPCLGRITRKGHQKMAPESTLRLHNDGAARQV